ncbi:hypothetical protein CLOACE_20690 [Clostridium acetireducens DSM 10703]|uniref:DUF4363 domain-containing protein n=1 Tax=Clostridium acetireducens DSM 10703 TaxID=1121290 RepID=A0A1E8EWC6_9CLOT|nr:DUF4363 family protein [Clostridium acetireducens]OFI01552.1 hypothetical protein CLOACE_20690 [Clostridium acetireducens DSM 10703]
MRKFLTTIIPIITLGFFILIMLSGNYLKRPLGKYDNVPNSIEVIIKDVNSENWKEANKNTDELNKIWKRIVSRVQFSSERDEINALSVNIARLKAAIMAKDKNSALLELAEAYEHWDSLGR